MSLPSPINRSNSTNNFQSNRKENSFLKNMNIRRANRNVLYQNLKKLENFKTFENIHPKETDWKKDIKDYEKEKKNFEEHCNLNLEINNKIFSF